MSQTPSWGLVTTPDADANIMTTVSIAKRDMADRNVGARRIASGKKPEITEE
jgi:hypothetical protein